MNVTDKATANRGKVHLHHGATIEATKSERALWEPLDELSREHEAVGPECPGIEALPLMDVLVDVSTRASGKLVERKSGLDRIDFRQVELERGAVSENASSTARASPP